MEEFIAALLGGLILSATQHGLNRYDWNAQNEYNEEMFNIHGSPSAIANDMSLAGMSDAGIASALGSYKGAGTQLMSSPLQPTNIDDSLLGMLGMYNETRKTSAEVDNLKADADKKAVEAGYTGLQAKMFSDAYKNILLSYDISNQEALSRTNKKLAEIDKIRDEQDILQTQKAILEIERYIKENSKDDSVKLIKQQIRVAASHANLNNKLIDESAAKIIYYTQQAQAIEDLKDVRDKEAAESRFYSEICNNTGLPYDVIKDIAGGAMQFIEKLLSAFGIPLSVVKKINVKTKTP